MIARFLSIIKKCISIKKCIWIILLILIVSWFRSMMSDPLFVGIPDRWSSLSGQYCPLGGEVIRIEFDTDTPLHFRSLPNEAEFIRKGHNKWHFNRWLPQKSKGFFLIKNPKTTHQQRLILWNNTQVDSKERNELEEGYTLNPKLSNEEFDWLIENCLSRNGLRNLIGRAQTKELLLALFNKTLQTDGDFLYAFACLPHCPDEIKSIIRESGDEYATNALKEIAFLLSEPSKLDDAD